MVEAEPGGRPLTLKIKLGKKPSEDVDERYTCLTQFAEAISAVIYREEEEEEEEEEEGSGAGDSLATPEQTWPQLTGGAVEEGTGHNCSESERVCVCGHQRPVKERRRRG